MKDRFSLSFKAFYFVYFGAIGAFAPYVNTYLEKYAGLSGSQIGLITAISLVVGVCVIPIWGVVGDKTRKYNALLKFSMMGSLVALYFYNKATVYPAIITCAVGLEMVRLGAIPMADTLATSYCHKTGGNYGSIRSMGSLGFMLAGVAVGFIADAIGLDGAIFATYAALLVLSISISFGFPKNESEENNNDKKGKIQKGSFKQLLSNKNFIFVLFIQLLMTTVVNAAMNYGGNHLTVTLGGSASSISFMQIATVLPEALFLMVALKVLNKTGYKKFYLIACLTMMLRFVTYALVPNQYAFLAVSIVHCIGVAVETVASLTFIRSSVDTAVLGTAITLLNATLSIGRAIYGYIFGFVYEMFGSFVMFGICLIPFIIAFIMISRTHCFDEIDKNKGNFA